MYKGNTLKCCMQLQKYGLLFPLLVTENSLNERSTAYHILSISIKTGMFSLNNFVREQLKCREKKENL